MRKVSKTKCPCCGKEISNSNIKKHLLSHELNPDYHKPHRYDAREDLKCIYCGKECKNKNSLAQHECRCKHNPNAIIVKSNLGEFITEGHTAWNKGLTKETDIRVLRNGEAVHNSYLSGKSKGLKGESNPSCRPEVREKISNTIMEKSKQGLWHTSLAKNMHIDYKGVDLHGRWELGYAKYLDLNNIKWERCKERFSYFFEDKERYYTPDFYLPETKTYVEVKGYSRAKDYAKWSQFPKNLNLLVIRRKELIELGVIDKYEKLLI